MLAANKALRASSRTEVAGFTSELLRASSKLVGILRTVGQNFSSRVAFFQLICGSKCESQGNPNTKSTAVSMSVKSISVYWLFAVTLSFVYSRTAPFALVVPSTLYMNCGRLYFSISNPNLLANSGAMTLTVAPESTSAETVSWPFVVTKVTGTLSSFGWLFTKSLKYLSRTPILSSSSCSSGSSSSFFKSFAALPSGVGGRTRGSTAGITVGTNGGGGITGMGDEGRTRGHL